MSVDHRVETEEDLKLVKEYTLLPILLDMMARDIEELSMYADKIVFHHAIFYLEEVRDRIFPELHRIRERMRQREIHVLSTEKTAMGIDVEYKVRGYIHHFKMLRSLIKAELMTLLLNLGRRLR